MIEDLLCDAPGAAPLPQDWLDVIAQIYASESICDVLSKRVEQALRWGHTPAADAERPPVRIAREAYDRLRDVLPMLDRERLDAATIDTALKKVTASAAILLALHDRLSLAASEADQQEAAP